MRDWFSTLAAKSSLPVDAVFQISRSAASSFFLDPCPPKK